MKKNKEFTFNGFEPSNTTPVPDVLFDELLSELNGSELKVLLYIIRRTRGFKKDEDAISLSQFQKGIITRDGKQLDKGCGIGDRQTIINALASLEQKKCIVSEKTKTTSGDNATTLYRVFFNTKVVGKTNHGSKKKPTTLVGNSNHGGRENTTTLVGNSNPQETVIQLDSLQETVIQQDTNSAQVVSDIAADALLTHSGSTHPLESVSLESGEATQPLEEKNKATTLLFPEFASQDEHGASVQDNGQASKQASSHSQKNAHKTASKEKKANTSAKPEPPQMPPEDAKWCDETAVQIFEAMIGRSYSKTTRAQEKTEAKRLLEMEYKGELLTREHFLIACQDMFSWKFWAEHSDRKPMIRTLRKDDKIIGILDGAAKQGKFNTNRETQLKQATQTASAIAEAQARDERNKASIEKMRQRKAAQEAKTKGA